MENMKDTEYYKSGKHIENVRIASEKGREASRLKKLARIVEYNAAPKLCKCCAAPLPYDKRRSTFCNRSCRAIVVNKEREISNKADFRIKQHHNKIRWLDANPDQKWVGRYCVLHEITCTVCGNKKLVRSRDQHKKTCSRDCQTTASIANRTYQNGKKKLIKYYNKWIDKEVNLESSWELTIAEMLDKKGIEWYRPKAMKWIDATGKNRLYYCDFYLPKYDTYLDPKNPYCMELDADKLKWFENSIKLIAGDIALIQMVVENLNEVNDNNQTS